MEFSEESKMENENELSEEEQIDTEYSEFDLPSEEEEEIEEEIEEIIHQKKKVEELPQKKKLEVGKIVEVPIVTAWAKPPKLVKKGKRKVYIKPNNSEYVPEYIPAPKFDDYGQEIEEDEVDFENWEKDVFVPKYKEGFDEPQGVFYGEGKWEEGIDLIEKEVDLYTGATGVLAKKYGVQKKVMKLVPVKVRRKVWDIQISYPYTQFMKVGEGGVLEPRIPPYKTTKIISEDVIPPINKVYSPPPKLEAPKPPTIYEGPIKFGSKIGFTTLSTDNVKGIVLDLSNDFTKILNIGTHRKILYKNSLIENIDVTGKYPVEIRNFDLIINVDGLDFFIGKDERSPSEKNEIKLGDIVEIKVTNIRSIKGTVLDFTESRFIVYGEDNRRYRIPFNDPSIRIIKRDHIKRILEIKGVPSLYDIMPIPVDMLLRRYIRDELFQKFSKIIPNIRYKAKESKISRLSQEELEALKLEIKPWGDGEIGFDNLRKNWFVKWSFENKEYQKDFPVGKDEKEAYNQAESFANNGYYAENFRSWMYKNSLEELKRKLTLPDISSYIDQETEKIADDYKNPQKIVLYLMKKYGDDIFNLNGFHFRQRLIMYKGNVEIIDVFIKSKFESIDTEELEKLRGNELAIKLTSIIQEYFRVYPPNTSIIRSEIERKVLWNEFNKINPSEKDRINFEKEMLAELQNIYEEHIKRYEDAKEKALEIELEQTKQNEKRIEIKEKLDKILGKIKGAINVSSNIYDNITEEGYNLFIDVEKFERDSYVFSGNGRTVLEYLVTVLFPLIFIEEPLKNYADFFREKVASGQIKISSLISASLPYYFPELAMNFETLSKNMWETAVEELSKILYNKVKIIIDIYIGLNYPSKQKINRQKFSMHIDWQKYVTSISDKCQEDTKSGKVEERDKWGDIVYTKDGLPKMKDIPLKDIVICYDKNSNKFSCHYLHALFREIKKSGEEIPVNPYTKERYPEQFIEEIKMRYPEEIKGAVIFETPKISETVSEDEDTYSNLFGSSSEEEEEEKEEYIEEPESVEQLNKLIPENRLSVVYVYTEWSKTYEKLKPIWDRLKSEISNVSFFKIDKLALGSNYGVKKVPSFIILTKENGNVRKVNMYVGDKEEKIKKFIIENMSE